MIEYLPALILAEDNPASWAQLLKPAGYCLAALPLFLLGTSEAVLQYADIRVRNLWLLLSATYLLVAAIGFVQGDVLFVQWIRPIFKAHRLYEYRRALQVVFLSLSAILLAALLLGMPGLSRQADTPCAARVLLLGSVVGTAGVYLLKFVSFHYTDLLLNALWLQQSIAFWTELACVGLACLATGVSFLGGRKGV